MTDILIPTLAALIGTAFGGLITYFTQRQQLKHNLQILKETYKTDFMAEETAKHFLSHKSHIERSFDVLQKHLGGFEDNELRKILVRSGAIREFREDGSEWWKLLSRMDEYIEKKRNGK
ncbi:MAG: hypothetical protein ABJH98_11880 [Reichenbachiella sp.]|uniref:hypothetical protein n=1 Tax=Reichenbachiella sp. TaxID=2184521 RepID=UPI0032992DFA